MTVEELQQIYKANLKMFRKHAGFSQAMLSEKASITDKFYNDIETDRKWGSFETLVSLATALNVEPYELFLPQTDVARYDKKHTQKLMQDLRDNVNATLNTLERFLSESNIN